MSSYIIGSNIEIITTNLRRYRERRAHTHKSEYLPTVTVLIPAHNEEVCVLKTIESVRASAYPASKLKIIVINDGSTDNTKAIVRNYIKHNAAGADIRLINQGNKGKAGALNYALKKYVRSTLVMTLDADSEMDKKAIRNSVAHFRDQKVLAASSNVNIIENDTILGLAQRFEYAIGYQMKRAEALGNIEYIIGGVGAMFRYKAIKNIGFFDTNTQTEDIDLTLKLLAHYGNKEYKLVHAHDAATYTAPVLTTDALVKQRLRWKYGRWQTFAKHKFLFFSKQTKYSKLLTWGILPYALLQELLLLVEPLAIVVTFYFATYYGDIKTFLFAIIVVTGHILINIWASDTISVKERLRLSYYAIPMYLLLYIVSYVEYAAILLGLVKLKKLRLSINNQHTTWKSPERALTN